MFDIASRFERFGRPWLHVLVRVVDFRAAASAVLLPALEFTPPSAPAPGADRSDTPVARTCTATGSETRRLPTGGVGCVTAPGQIGENR